MKIGIAIPSHRPELALRMARSAYHCAAGGFSSIAQFQFFFQPPHTEQTIKEVCSIISGFGFDVLYTFGERQEKPASMTSLRYNAAVVDTSPELYMIADEDFVFGGGTPQYRRPSGERYVDCINYMDAHPKCGAIMCNGPFGGQSAKELIIVAPPTMIATQRGIVIRNLRDQPFYSEEERTLRGTYEESVAVYRVLARGYYLAKQFNNPTQHRTAAAHGAAGVISRDHAMDSIYSLDLLEANAVPYIRKQYNDPHWAYENRKLPRAIIEAQAAAGLL